MLNMRCDAPSRLQGCRTHALKLPALVHARQPACPFDAEPVQARGLVKRCTCRVDTKLIKAEKGVSKAEARRRQV